jgi:streptomycin 6-kinase
MTCVRNRCDLDVVDAMARLQITAQRIGVVVRLRTDDARLLDLVEFLGLTAALRLEDGRQAEGGEELRIEEVVEADDPSV